MNPASAPVHPTSSPSSPIPVDLFVSKKHFGHRRGELDFLDSSGETVYRVTHQCQKTSSHKRVLLDAAGNPLFSLRREDDGSWEAYEGGGSEEKDLKFRVKRTKNKLIRFRTELEVFLVGENSADSACDFKLKGFPLQKSCTIYGGNEIVAQMSLMKKLPKRGKLLTIFPGPVDHALCYYQPNRDRINEMRRHEAVKALDTYKQTGLSVGYELFNHFSRS